MREPRLGLGYDDVLIVPRRSTVGSRRDVSTTTRFTSGIPLSVPIVSANMDTVTTAPMAITLAQLGGIGAVHRFLDTPLQVAEVEQVKRSLHSVIQDPYTIDVRSTIGRARAESRQRRVTSLLVTDDDRRLLGILTERDVRAATKDDTLVEETMTPYARLVTARPDVSPRQARALMNQHRIEKLPLIDDDGRIAGLITLRDLGMSERYPDATRDQHGRLRVAAAVGTSGDYMARAEALIEVEADALVLDIAHGHADHAIDAVTAIKKAWPECELVAGNVATPEGFRDLAAAGADAVKVGIGPGFACTTRLVAGVGIPQFTAVQDCAAVAREVGVPLIADGGIRRAGDLAKAVAAGASSVMVGSLFAGRSESPGDVVRREGRTYKVYRGMASRSAATARLTAEGKEESLDQYVPEGEEMEFPLQGPASEVIDELVGGLRSGMSYVDATTIEEFWANADFVRQTEAGRQESHPGRPPN